MCRSPARDRRWTYLDVVGELDHHAGRGFALGVDARNARGRRLIWDWCGRPRPHGCLLVRLRGLPRHSDTRRRSRGGACPDPHTVDLAEGGPRLIRTVPDLEDEIRASYENGKRA